MKCCWYNSYYNRKWTQQRVQIVDKAVCISQSVNALGKDINPTILLQAMDK